PARRALDEAFLDQARLDNVLDGVAWLGQGGGKRFKPDPGAARALRGGGEGPPVHGVEPGGVDLERAERTVGRGAVDALMPGDEREVAHAPQQPPGDARGAARAPRDLVGAVRRHADAEHARPAIDDLLELRLGVKIEPDWNAEAVAQRI